MRKTIATIFAFGFFWCSGFAADWPQWRGPSRDANAPGPAWPDSLQEPSLSKMWRVEFGPSYSGPIVVGDRVFTTETKDKAEEVVIALDRVTGKVLWRSNWAGAMTVPFFAASNGSWIRATPACDGESLFVAGMRDVLVCLDTADGSQRWRVDFAERYKSPLPAFGFVSSPLVEGNAIYVQAGASCVKLDKKTGQEIWRTLADAGGMNGSAFSSPILATLAGRKQLLVQSRESLAGVDSDSGRVLWSQPVQAMRGMNILTPTVIDNGIFTSSYGGKSLRFDLQRSPTNDFSVTTAWTNKLEGYMCTPVIVNSHAYLHLRNQRAACIDLKTGKQTWITERSFGKYWNLVANGDRILALDERGILLLLRANPDKFELVDQRKISDQQCWGHLAVVGDELFVRELNALTAYRWKK